MKPPRRQERQGGREDTFGFDLSGMKGRERICDFLQTLNLLGVLGALAVLLGVLGVLAVLLGVLGVLAVLPGVLGVLAVLLGVLGALAVLPGVLGVLVVLPGVLGVLAVLLGVLGVLAVLLGVLAVLLLRRPLLLGNFSDLPFQQAKAVAENSSDVSASPPSAPQRLCWSSPSSGCFCIAAPFRMAPF
ncbi:MAG: hypothetical protein ACOX52_13400 [Verrucomicrobiota bacterium]